MTNPNDQAFSATEILELDGRKVALRMGGLTKREYFALHLMGSIIASPRRFQILKVVEEGKDPVYVEVEQSNQYAETAGRMADALIAELNKKSEEK